MSIVAEKIKYKIDCKICSIVLNFEESDEQEVIHASEDWNECYHYQYIVCPKCNSRVITRSSAMETGYTDRRIRVN